jgi:hypothetical protein
VRFLATRYPHWGGHAGIGQFTRHLADFTVDYHLVNDDDSQLPLPFPAWRDRLRRRGALKASACRRQGRKAAWP